ncbi:hypothetical protein BC832DRAFT_54341 [Gaertneriomyces semiglobifer]|nr:hypothetical protein BC832DRAFT_54341 [Gaertneriomyces semiglobifer]
MPNASQIYSDYVSFVTQEANRTLHSTLPLAVQHLQKCISTRLLPANLFLDHDPNSGTANKPPLSKKRKHPEVNESTGGSESNGLTLVDLEDLVKSEILGVLSICAGLRGWCQINQASTMRLLPHLTRTEDTCLSLLSSFQNYHAKRASLLGNTPAICHDITKSVNLLDEAQHVGLAMVLRDLLTACVGIWRRGIECWRTVESHVTA